MIDNNNKDVCLSCSENVAVIKECNVQAHYSQSTKANLTLGLFTCSCLVVVAFLNFAKLPV